ncbi:MAG: PQQ-binding-like beta-propeller repeat protein [Rariglobus sp.]|jgi:outer membrane protein assembly factor BamB|nr:PQQ-binding-like beta-propeller repeat protein [Rariglobus sp.]
MNAEDIFLLATKGTVVAMHRETGRRLWEAQLKSGLGGDFVSLVADMRKVFAHTRGEVFCLDLFTGRILWKDGLSGLGYNLASLALPGSPESLMSVAAQRLAQEHAAADSSNSSAGHGH